MPLRYPLVYGVVAGLIIVILSAIAILLGALGHSSSPLMGYLIMLVGLTMIFVGIKRFRDVEGGGVITFMQAFGLGLAIGFVTAVIYAASFELYMALTGFDFTAWFGEVRQQELVASGASPAAIEVEMSAIREFGESYSDPLVRIPMHFLEIAPALLIVSLVSAAILRNPRALPAHGG